MKLLRLLFLVAVAAVLTVLFTVPLALAEGGVFTVPESSPTTVFAAVFAVLWSISEALSFIPAVKANGIFQAVVNILKMLAGRS